MKGAILIALIAIVAAAGVMYFVSTQQGGGGPAAVTTTEEITVERPGETGETDTGIPTVTVTETYEEEETYTETSTETTTTSPTTSPTATETTTQPAVETQTPTETSTPTTTEAPEGGGEEGAGDAERLMEQYIDRLLNSKFTVEYSWYARWDAQGYQGNASASLTLSVDGPGKRAYIKMAVIEAQGGLTEAMNGTVEQIIKGDIDSGYLKKTVIYVEGSVMVQTETHRKVSEGQIEVCTETKMVFQGREIAQPKQCTTFEYNNYVRQYGEPDARKAAYNFTRGLFEDYRGVDYLGTRNVNGIVSDCFGVVDSAGRAVAELCFAKDSGIITRAYFKSDDSGFEFSMELDGPPRLGTFLEEEFARVERT